MNNLAIICNVGRAVIVDDATMQIRPAAGGSVINLNFRDPLSLMSLAHAIFDVPSDCTNPRITAFPPIAPAARPAPIDVSKIVEFEDEYLESPGGRLFELLEAEAASDDGDDGNDSGVVKFVAVKKATSKKAANKKAVTKITKAAPKPANKKKKPAPKPPQRKSKRIPKLKKLVPVEEDVKAACNLFDQIAAEFEAVADDSSAQSDTNSDSCDSHEEHTAGISQEFA